MDEEKKIEKNKIIQIVIIVIFSLVFLFSLYKVIDYILQGNKSDNVYNATLKDVSIVKQENEHTGEQIEKYVINYDDLKAQNEDTIGFLKVNGTEVNHVIVQAKDNSYYLSNNFLKQHSSEGWPFVDYRNKLDGKDKNIIIYGHNMKNNNMFGTLGNVLNKEWQENTNNHEIIFNTINGDHVYKVFSVYSTEVEDYYIQTDFAGNEFKNFADELKSRSEYDFNVKVNNDDQILTLSTCGISSKYRVVVHAVKVK
jgi:sortase B